MWVLIVMAAGVLLGMRWFPQRWMKVNTQIQVACTAILIFSMGVKLGSRENFLEELADLGLSSLLFAVIPILFSVIFVYILTQKFLKKARPDSPTEEQIMEQLEEELQHEFEQERRKKEEKE